MCRDRRFTISLNQRSHPTAFEGFESDTLDKAFMGIFEIGW
jgi:hypothetical protein